MNEKRIRVVSTAGPLHALDNGGFLGIIGAEDGSGPGTGTGSGSWPIYNVKTYGAVGDGVTDDSAAIQACIDAVPETGGTIFFPIGSYAVYTGLTCLNKPNVAFLGEIRSHRPTFRNDTVAANRGCNIVGMTAGMTVLRIGRTGGGGTGGTATLAGTFLHNGPQIENIAIHDGTFSKPLISAINGWAVVSGTRYRITYLASLQLAGQRSYVAGDSVYFSDRHISQIADQVFEALDAGTSGSNNYIEIDPGVALPAFSTSAPFSLETLVDETSMTLLQIDSYTRFMVRRCHFALGEYGLKITNDAHNDVSWGLVEDNSVTDNKYGVWVDPGAGGAASMIIQGGDISVPSNGVGILVGESSVASFTNLIIGDFKIDLGKDANTSGDGAIGVDLRAASNFQIRGLRYECFGECTCIRIGKGPIPAPHATEPPVVLGASFGKIYACSFQHNTSTGEKGVAIHLTGRTDSTSATLRAYGCNVFGNTSNQFGTLVKVDNYSHNNNIYGNTYLVGDYGVRLDATTYLNNVFGNNHAREDTATIAVVDDLGTKNNVYLNPDATGRDQDFIPTRDPLIISPERTDLVGVAMYPSRGYVPDLAQFRVEADDITDDFTGSDGTAVATTTTGESWTINTSFPSAAGLGTWNFSGNKLIRTLQVHGGQSVVSTRTVTASADFTMTCDLTTSAGSTRAGLCFRLVDGDDFLTFFILQAAGTHIINLRKVVGGTQTALQSVTETIAPSTTLELKVVAKLQNIKCYVDGVKKIDYDLTVAEQATFLTPANLGTFSQTFSSSTNDDGGSTWDDFSVQYTVPALGVGVDGILEYKLDSMIDSSAGAATGDYMKVRVNGVIHKIALLADA